MSPSPPMPGSCLTWLCTGPVHAVIATTSSRVLPHPSVSVKHCLAVRICSICFLCSLLLLCFVLGEDVIQLAGPFGAEHSSGQHYLSRCGSEQSLISIFCKRKVLQWGLRDAPIYGFVQTLYGWNWGEEGKTILWKSLKNLTGECYYFHRTICTLPKAFYEVWIY